MALIYASNGGAFLDADRLGFKILHVESRYERANPLQVLTREYYSTQDQYLSYDVYAREYPICPGQPHHLPAIRPVTLKAEVGAALDAEA